MPIRNLTALVGLFLLQGCALMGGRLNVDPVAVSAQKPGNVALYVAVSRNGSGVVGLEPKDFKVYENGVALDSTQIQLTLLPPDRTTSRRAAVLVDMSKSLTPDERKSLSDALRPFISRLRQREPASLYAYDGAEKAHLVQEYSVDAHAVPDEKDTNMDRLLGFSRKDASSSLYSAVLDGAQKLETALAAEGRPVESGTVVVIALSPDSAGRVEEGKLRDFIDDSPLHFFLMTVGANASNANLSFIGKSGGTRAGSAMTMSAPLNDVANAVEDSYDRNYLVSYCSPARAGKRDVRLEVMIRDAQGKRSVGSYSTEVDANGFGPGCNPQTAPQLVLTKPKQVVRLAANEKPAAKAAAKAPHTAVGPAPSRASGTAPEPKSNAPASIAEPPSGLGYE